MLNGIFKGAVTRTLYTSLCVLFLIVGAGIDARADDFGVDRYNELYDAVDAADARRARATPGDAAHRSATLAAIQARQEVLDFFSRWLSSGTMTPELRGEAEAERIVLLQNIIALHAGIGNCGEARGALSAVEIFLDRSNEDHLRTLQSARRQVESCDEERRSVTTATPPTSPAEPSPGGPSAPTTTTPPSVVEPLPPPADERRSPVLAYSLMGAGGAMLIGGLVWDLTLAGTRSDYDGCRSDPGGCTLSPSELEDARKTLAGAKVPIAILTLGGGAAAITGAVLFFTRGRSPSSAESASEESAWRWSLTPTLGGAILRTQF